MPRQELKLGKHLELGADAEAMKLLTSLYLMVSSACILIATTSPGVAPPTVGWVLPHGPLIKKTLYRLVYSWIL